MLTPQEVSERSFSKAGFGGYNMAMVDEFLDQVTGDYTTLYKENAVLKSKMKVLVDKVEEYRSTEEAMRKALLTAQKMADEMVSAAEERKAELLQNAEEEDKAKLEDIRKEIADEEYRLTTAQNATAAYLAKLKELYRHEMEYLEGMSRLTAPAVSGPDEKATIAREIEASLEKQMEGETGEFTIPVQEPEEESEEDEESQAEEVTAQTRRIPSAADLRDLGFGR